MLNWQVMLTHLHDWAGHHFFAPTWQNLELETATHLIYRMEISCHRFNQLNLQWQDGRPLRICVDKPPNIPVM